MVTNGHSLAGLRVLVTRPAHQADRLCALIEHAGGTALRFPTIEISPPQDSLALEHIIERLDEFDLAIFVSPNAVNRAFPLIQRRHATLPPQLDVACIGNGSAAALAQFGVTPALVPATRADSEGLLALPRLQHVTGLRIVIFRGEGGRELLADTLVARGAHVEHAQCYRRTRPMTDVTALTSAFTQHAIDVVTITSIDALRNLYDMLDASARESLRQMPVITVSKRLQQTCQTLSLRGPVQVAETASDEAVVAALDTWRRSQKPL